MPSSKPWVLANSATSSGSLLTPRIKRRRPLLPCAASTMDLPQRPRPMTAASIIGRRDGRAAEWSASYILGMPEMPLQAAAPGSYDGRRKQRGNGYARDNIDLGRSVMDRRAFPAIRFVGGRRRRGNRKCRHARCSRDTRRRHRRARARLVEPKAERRAGGQALRRAALGARQCHPGERRRLGSGPHRRHSPRPRTERRAGHGRIAQAREAAGRYLPGFRSAGQQTRSDGQGGRASRRQGRGPRQLFHGRQLLGLGDVDHRRGQPKTHNLERQETRGIRQIHRARRPSHRMGRAALSRQIAAGDFPSAAQLPKRRQECR